MKKKIKLRDLTKKQWDNFVDKCKMDCDNCVCDIASCKRSELKGSWFNNKDMFSDKFLNQEIEVEVKDENILTKEEKKYLSFIIKPFMDRVISITKYKKTMYDPFEFIAIELINVEAIILPRFKENTMYKGMECSKAYTLEELNLSQPKYKITLTEFWKSKEHLAIHCNTKEKAEKLLKDFDKLGETWKSGDSYLDKVYWDYYKKNTCYNNINEYAGFNYYEKENYKIYEFEDVDLDN